MKLSEIKKIAVIGCGTMGQGMALEFALAGYEVGLYGRNPEKLDLAQKRIKQALKLKSEEGLTSPAQAEKAPKLIQYVTNLDEAVKNSQLVQETVSENLELKQDFFQKIEALSTDETILASNTSGLSISEIAKVLKKPERMIGIHFSNPPELVPVVEIIKGKKTDDNTAQLAYDLITELGKMPVMIKKEVPGFALNRLQYALFREALHLVDEGVVSLQDVDKTLKYGPGFRWSWIGALETADLGGLDVFNSVSNYLFKDLCNDEKPPKVLEDLVKQNKLGVKTGQGFYKYSEEDKKRIIEQRDRYFARQWKLIKETKGE